MPERELNDWFKSYLEFVHNTESPTSYHRWAAISCIAGALQRKCFIRRGLETIYPNNYIILVGPSGKARKGLPITIARSFVEGIGVSLLAETNTQQSIIIQMKKSTIPFRCASTDKMIFSSAVTTMVEELAVLTGYQNGELLACLTNWYDSRDKWDYRTKNMGEDEILGVCFNMLSATAPDWLPHILTREAIGGGFTSRCIFVYEPDKKQTIADPDAIPINYGLQSKLQKDLERVATFNGEFKRDSKAKLYYEDWYLREDQRIRKGQVPVEDPTFASYLSRRATHVLKISMAFSAARRNDLKITEQDMKDAISILEDAEKRMDQVFAGIGRARYSEETTMVEEYLAKKKRSTRSDILRAFNRDLDDSALASVVSTLYASHKIRVVRDTDSERPETHYEWIG